MNRRSHRLRATTIRAWDLWSVSDRRQRFRDQPETGNIVETGYNGQIAYPNDLLCPVRPARRQVDNHKIIPLRDQSKEGIKRLDVQVEDAFLLRGRRKHVKTAVGMATYKQIEQLRIEPIGVVHDLTDLQARFDIQIVADVAGLDIKIQKTDPFVPRLFATSDLHGRLNCQRGISDAAATGHKHRDGGPAEVSVRRAEIFSA